MKDKNNYLFNRLITALLISWWICFFRIAWYMFSLYKAEKYALSKENEKRLWGRCRLRHLVDYIEYRHPHWCFHPGGWVAKQTGISILRAGSFTIESGDVNKGDKFKVEQWQFALVSALKVEYLIQFPETSKSPEPKKALIPSTRTETVPLDLTTIPVEEFVELNSGHR